MIYNDVSVKYTLLKLILSQIKTNLEFLTELLRLVFPEMILKGLQCYNGCVRLSDSVFCLVSQSACLSVYLSVCLFVCLSV